jgi:PAS domain S-box-containing protein
LNTGKPAADLSQYVLEVLRNDEEFVLYRGEDSNQSNSTSVLLLAPVLTQPAPETFKKMDYEYSLKNELDSAWAIRPQAVSEERGRAMLMLEDPGGETLDHFLRGPMELTQFLRFGIGLASALGGLHKKELIHKDLKPANVFVNPATGQVWLMGFGIASRLPRERQAPDPPEFIAGTLPYMAPEQTGRMNRSIDSRSDLYALGVTLYEMVTGTLPFTASDPMEMVHCHIARRPAPPCVRLNAIPAQVSAIIMKLLAKTAEERYQTATGVESDLRRCLTEWESHHRISEFRLGDKDVPGRLLIPERLYGRESEINALLAAFDRVVASGKPELVLVSGYSGIGKSAVVNELHKSLVPPRGLFASGKFDQYKRDIPYSTLAQAFQGLIRRLLGKNEGELAPWRDALRDALGANGGLIIDLVPELELIIGGQPPVPDLPPQDARRRFQLVFRRFVGVFAQPSHPLALFLDDLQWLDAATLDIVGDLLTHQDVHHLMLIGAYRDNEVNSFHPLMRKHAAVLSTGAAIHEIKLAPLDRDCITELVTDALHTDIERAVPLAQLVHEKTAGNPFFVIQFLRVLVDEGLLVLTHDTTRWSWDLDRIHDKRYTDNVVDLVAGKLTRLPAKTKKALQQLACVGNSAEITMLSTAFDMSGEEVHADLWEAVRLELVQRLDGSYKFLHDRVQEAAYSLIPEALRASTHLRIGRLLAERTPPERRHEAIFEIVNQFNRGVALITEQAEREELAELNLIAGRRAKASTAYASARTYLHTGIAALGSDAWASRYELAFALRLECAECEYLSGNFDEAERLIAVLLAKGVSKTDKASVYRLKIDLHVMRSENPKAIEGALECLRLFGIDMSAHPTREHVEDEYEKVWNGLGGRPIESLIDLPLVTDPEIRAAMHVLSVLFAPAFFTDINLVYLHLCHMVNLTLRYGTTDASSPAFGWFGVLLGPVFRRYVDGYRFGRLACELVERHGALAYKAKTYFAMEMVALWAQPPETALDYIRRAFQAGVEGGDLAFACYSCNHTITDLLVQGDHLDAIWQESERNLEFASKARFRDVVDIIVSQQRFIDNMRGKTANFSTFSSAAFDEKAFESQLTADRMTTMVCWYWILKVQARFMSGDYDAAVDAAAKAKALLWSSEAHIQLLDYYYYSALALAADYDRLPPGPQCERHEILTAHLHQLNEWAESCSPTFFDRRALVAAEIARVEARVLDAEQLYEKAIHSAHANGFVHNEALACELAARFYAARGFEKIANTYLGEARYGYLRWGAEGKVRQLDQLYPQLRQDQPATGSLGVIATPVEQMDLATVIKASQAVSAEMVFEKLIDKLLRTAIEHAGAERGLLIIPQGDELRIEAEAITSGEKITVHPREDAKTAKTALELPESLVRYVTRAQETVILEDASSQNQFSSDPYIAHRRARSILCLPLTNQAKLIGILYLENNLTPDAFTAGRVTVLKVLASQAAISLENSRLYRDLADREGKIRRLVDANILGIFIWNLQGTIIAANEAFLRMVQYDREDLVSGCMRWTDLTPAEWRERDERAVTEVRATGTAQPYEKEFFRKDGGRVPVLIGGALFEEAGGEGVAFVLDLGEQKRAETEIRALKDQVSRANQVATIGELTASIAHEVNQPLAAVVANAEAGLQWLDREKPNLDGVRQALQRIARDGTDAGEIVKRVRGLFRRVTPLTAEQRLEELVAEVLKLIEHERIRRGVSVELALGEGLPAVLCDRLQIQQVLLNLMMNAMDALDAARQGARTIRIFSNWGGAESIVLGIRDYGGGVQDPRRLFEAFFTTKEKGLGMGLAISRSIVEAHGGRLWLEPTNGPGSTFCFRLPVKRSTPGQI